MIITLLEIWAGEGNFWGLDVLRVNPWDRALLSIYHHPYFGWEFNILFVDVL
jgi:hypothetical protein